MALRWYQISVDARDAAMLARWWADVLDWELGFEDEYEVNVVPPGTSDDPVDTVQTWRTMPPTFVFAPVPEGKTVKNRLHIDLAPHIDQDRDALIEQLLTKGASRVDVGQDPDVTWTVLADPEGNEFCVLSSRDR
ncbi:VOC family protein [Janibacter alittae]|uniref:VOC family protein n=1 Tax=Janibacter alittae TaxID=3115209 RepID=A0ABZ2MIJ8_9MICO